MPNPLAHSLSLRAIRARQHHYELLSPIARDPIVLAYFVSQGVGYRNENAVSSLVSIGVIDLLEVVNVTEQV